MIRQCLHLTTSPLLLLLLIALSSIGTVVAKSDGPKIASIQLETEPSMPFYFENSDTVLFLRLDTGEVYQSFDGGVEWKVLGKDHETEGETAGLANGAVMIQAHPYDNQKAYILGRHGVHWVTTDQGKTWREFEVPAAPSMFNEPLRFHGEDSGKVIFQGERCSAFACVETSYYTRNNFETVKPMRDTARGCMWAVATPGFADSTTEHAEEIRDRVLCIVHGLKNPFASAYRLVYSDSFFEDDQDGIEAKLNEGRPVAGIINAAARTKYIVAAAKSQGTDELAMFVTDDAITWHRAEFGNHKIEESAYTVLEGTNYSIEVDVMNTDRSTNMGVLFTSNSNGTYFTRNIEHTNRDMSGLVDFEKIAGVQGIVLVNVVDNWEEIENDPKADRKVISKISFDDGRTFQSLKVKDKDLHLHSVTAFENIGRVFSSPAPGIVMGVGNTGTHLKSYTKDGDLYVSDDAGVTWRLALEKPHKYEIGNKGAIIMAIKDNDKPTKKIQYSINHGKDWETAELDREIIPYFLTTTPDSTSLKFMLVGYVEDPADWYIYAIDFEGLHERECKDSDFENWPARLDENGEPDCLMGHKQFYRRRKSDANCFITETMFKTPKPEFKSCKCTAEDFECDYNFVRSEDRKECVPATILKAPEGTCKNDDDTFKGPSGWRLIPGNVCTRDGAVELDKEIDRPCKDALKTPSGDSKAVSSTANYIETEMFGEFFYLERAGSSRGEDETIIMRTTDGKLYVTHDHGKSWTHELKDVKIQQIAPHRYLNDRAFFLTSGKKQYYTINRAESFDAFSAPAEVNPSGLTLGYHEEFKDWMIWTGPGECSHGECPKVSFISKHRGDDWEILLRAVEKCEFMAREDRKDSGSLIFCDQHEGEKVDGQRMLVTSNDFFATSTTPLTNIIDFATMAEFIIIATRNPEKENSLKVDASVNGVEFADAEFPYNLEVPVQLAYTVLDSSTHSVFLHVTANNKMDQSYGSIIKSNSNGTSYVLSLNDVNRNNGGYVDFEKLPGLEGVALANVVSNTKNVEKGSEKKLTSMITHNDGSQWTLIPPPAKDSEGKPYSCGSDGKPTDKCSLHLHGYTERRDPRDSFGSASAIGLLFGVGNVGESLGSKSEASTFFSSDGGISWKEVKKGNYMWKFGDQGSVLVLVEELKPTRDIYFSTDEGDTWEKYQFSEKEVTVQSLSTVPSGTSKNFLIWGKETGSSKLVTINLDFSGLRDRTCNLDEDTGESEDYYLWEPKHPLQEGNCLFGHVEQYHRKKPSSHCWNDWSEAHVHRISHNCTCTEEDYECDYNYERQTDGSCALVPGLLKPNAIDYCRENPEAIEYWEPTGYRRIPLTTCQGGKNLDRWVSRPCPSHEEEYQRKHGPSGAVIFFAIIVPITIAVAAGYWVYTRWDGKFGQIRLGDGGAQSFVTSRGDSPFITIPVAIIAGTVAAVKVLPLLVMSLWRSVTGYVRIPGRRGPRPYATRDAFAARRGDYTHVVDDEDELLGDDEFEDEEGDERN
ncbi:vacuolar protein sorting protein, putative [Talaromyces stipitatus ATCC 10500]|uniref:Vacuolar protein sorting/targeting protein 10 n=1 Tax=Talaromyces stipitatus (strain ATCC 10500 / CBS 375.48 / QM 6759 / NRRL 1006) TaxID=441959 RepID=VPS10_TALSN|nr:vacuolar protein sorting protein, putative [Talaromyces stipitatus ATCC 10500]B8MG72.1 RecName: Full=Vacuolar protein sorting/targeting protein 10; AltName: Full=Carboxypeptidase Y receptor; Short=CPY receptor; AltName: Full=Sortilin vps10; AltName: Full=Vacuolar carboxypeptidase sorting receptor vps10; Flags: Precursor [Talaromyces stipitatus ATCC 10500]EED15939.1 vacuolar protein sorting protein, putative [Talaromyces stipitatus ATCC 10500]